MPLPSLKLSTDVAPATKWNVLQLIDCSPLRSTPITEASSLLWALLTSHSSLLLRLMRPSVRSPRLRCTLFPLIHLPHLLVLPATFGTSSLLADLSVFPSLICGSCSSGQGFAYSFLQIPPRDGHPCCSAMCFVVAYAHSGLSPVRARPWRANHKKRPPERSLKSFSKVIYQVNSLTIPEMASTVSPTPLFAAGWPVAAGDAFWL